MEKVEVESNLINGKVKYDIGAYKRRWWILFIFILYAALNSFQWIEYAIIANIVMRYYNVSSLTVDWTSLVYLALYVPLVLPASYIIDKKGLRVAVLIGGLGTALGTAIKIFSINRDSFHIVLIGQSILAASQLLILPLPPRIAAVWFKPNEVSTACSLGVFSTLLGDAIGFVLPPIIVKNHSNPDDIGADLKHICWGLTVFTTLVALALISCFIKIGKSSTLRRRDLNAVLLRVGQACYHQMPDFPPQPPKAPSVTQAIERQNQCEYTMRGFFTSIKVLFKNGPFVIHIIAYGINFGVTSAIGTLLNQFVLQYFQNAEKDAGRMGLLMVVTGMIGSIAFGVFLDKFHKYKETAFTIYLFSSLSVVLFMFALELKSIVLVYLSVAIVGLFVCAYMPVGFELAMELTYPSPESTTTGLLMAPAQIFGVIFTLILGQLNQTIGPFWALSSQAGLLLLGTVMTGFIKNHRRRQNAFEMQKIQEPNNQEPT